MRGVSDNREFASAFAELGRYSYAVLSYVIIYELCIIISAKYSHKFVLCMTEYILSFYFHASYWQLPGFV